MPRRSRPGCSGKVGRRCPTPEPVLEVVLEFLVTSAERLAQCAGRGDAVRGQCQQSLQRRQPVCLHDIADGHLGEPVAAQDDVTVMAEYALKRRQRLQSHVLRRPLDLPRLPEQFSRVVLVSMLDVVV